MTSYVEDVRSIRKALKSLCFDQTYILCCTEFTPLLVQLASGIHPSGFPQTSCLPTAFHILNILKFGYINQTVPMVVRGGGGGGSFRCLR